MANPPNFSHGKTFRALFNGSEVHQFFNKATLESKIENKDKSVFGDSAHTYLDGQEEGSLNMDGLLDTTTAVGNDALFRPTLTSGVKYPWLICPLGYGLNLPYYMLKTDTSGFNQSFTQNDIDKLTVNSESSIGVQFCQSGHTGGLATDTLGASPTTVGPIDFGASGGANGLMSCLEIVYVDPALSLITGEVKHGTVSGTYASFSPPLLHTQTSAAYGDIQDTGPNVTVNEFVALKLTYTGTGLLTYDWAARLGSAQYA